MRKSHRQPLAAIDIGTNSFHLIIADVNRETGRFRILDREKEIVRLGSGPTDMKYISETAMNRGIETLRHFRSKAASANAIVRAVATSAVREALNQDEFVRRVKAETGITVEIASGIEEARLIYLGVLQGLPVYHQRVLLVDIGGGSTEFLVGKERNIEYDNSVKLGAVRLTERFFGNGKPGAKAVRQCRNYVQLILNPVVRSLRRIRSDKVIGTSGTINTIARMIRYYRDHVPPDVSLNNYTFKADDCERMVEKLIGAGDLKKHRNIIGLDPGRKDIILAGAILLEQIIAEFDIRMVTVSEYALREGIILDSIEKTLRRKQVDRLDDIRYGSVLHIAENFNYERIHSHHVAGLAMQIFDQTASLHHCGASEREYLEAAAILHEVGLFLSHSNHHRHSYYMIRNAELLGFNENEKEIIANVARYHRKSHPKYKHEGFRHLSADDRRTVEILAGILRIADGLDRTHLSAIEFVRCRKSRDAVTFFLRKKGDADIHLEILGAEYKKELFENTLHRLVKFTVR